MSYDSDKKQKRGGKKFNKKFFEEEYELVKEESIKYINGNKYNQINPDKEKKNTNDKFSKPRNYSQKKLSNFLKNPSYRIIVASGPAGTGKTLFSVEEGLKNFTEGKVDKIIFTRPSVSVDEKLGFLPGTLEDKMAPWIRPIFDIVHNFITPKNLEKLIEDKIFEICPLGYMRGRTFKNCWIVADEMQNSTIAQMKMLLTRIGENSKLVITGDLEQNDLFGKNGLDDFLDKIRGRRSDSINSVEFLDKDIEREEVVKEVLDIYRTNNIPYSNDNIDKCSNEDSDKSYDKCSNEDSDKCSNEDSDKCSNEDSDKCYDKCSNEDSDNIHNDSKNSTDSCPETRDELDMLLKNDLEYI
jgi:phosphate starvation-inducible protein PhoH and related proteins